MRTQCLIKTKQNTFEGKSKMEKGLTPLTTIARGEVLLIIKFNVYSWAMRTIQYEKL